MWLKSLCVNWVSRAVGAGGCPYGAGPVAVPELGIFVGVGVAACWTTASPGVGVGCSSTTRLSLVSGCLAAFWLSCPHAASNGTNKSRQSTYQNCFFTSHASFLTGVDDVQ